MVVFKENATSDVMASGSVRTAPEPTVKLSILALKRCPHTILRQVREIKRMASLEIRFFATAVVKLNTT